MKILIISLLILFSHNLFSQTETDYFEIGNAKYDLEDHRGAVLDYTKAIEINTKYSKAYYYRGFTKNLLGDKNGGCLDWSKAGELGYADAYDMIKKYCN